jgi:hypothetical protein
LRGSKGNSLEGGVRAVGFVAGGFVASAIPAMVGAKLNGIVHIADWLATLCELGGIDPHDARAEAAGLPAIDSISMWPYLSGHVKNSPRSEVHIDRNAYISGDLKLLTGDISRACWGGPLYPNASTGSGPHYDQYGTPCNTTLTCGQDGCLFDVGGRDREERVDLAADPAYAQTLASLRAKLKSANERLFKPDRGSFDQRACAAAARYGGYWGPFAP